MRKGSFAGILAVLRGIAEGPCIGGGRPGRRSGSVRLLRADGHWIERADAAGWRVDRDRRASSLGREAGSEAVTARELVADEVRQSAHAHGVGGRSLQGRVRREVQVVLAGAELSRNLPATRFSDLEAASGERLDHDLVGHRDAYPRRQRLARRAVGRVDPIDLGADRVPGRLVRNQCGPRLAVIPGEDQIPERLGKVLVTHAQLGRAGSDQAWRVDSKLCDPGGEPGEEKAVLVRAVPAILQSRTRRTACGERSGVADMVNVHLGSRAVSSGSEQLPGREHVTVAGPARRRRPDLCGVLGISNIHRQELGASRLGHDEKVADGKHGRRLDREFQGSEPLD